MSYIVKGYKDILFDPIGSISNCHRVNTKLDMRLETTICAKCSAPCDMWIPETVEEFKLPEVIKYGFEYRTYLKFGLEHCVKYNKSLGGRDNEE